MSTRSRIGIVNADKTVISIYCHHDGYLSWTGARLLDSYNTEEKVRELLALGNLSGVGQELGKQHKQGDPGTDDWCLAYHRDNGDSDEEAVTTSRKEFLAMSEEYNYLFDNGEWKVMNGTPSWKRLALEVIAHRITS